MIDERQGRKIVYHFGIPHIGWLGVLLQAKQEKVIPLVKPILDKLLYEVGFWLSRKRYHHKLQLAGEN
ncbi:MAG: DUF3368 domain-containing protein [candidate division KSB1 bacterium]|nr:DUF3368 domain-containing protein [candidate division KSB1 bacterium]MDQ7066031.1 DUF3368 domain-containing protein [candidate division KSB1 bacterium]